MKLTLGIFYGSLLSLVYVFVGGIIKIQMMGAANGAVFNFQNEVVGVTTARTPVLHPISLAVLGLLIVLALLVPANWKGKSFLFGSLLSFAITTASLAVWAATIRDTNAPAPTVGLPLGWEGWLQRGGANPAAHLSALLAIAALWLFKPTENATAATGESELNQDN